MGILGKLLKGVFGSKSSTKAPSVKTGQTGKPITCLQCGARYATKSFVDTNGVCSKCQNDHFSFLTDEIPDDELAANQNLSEGAKFILDADDRHMKDIEGRKLIIFLRREGLL